MGGFPPHPHRGMETLTYLRKGALHHKDHLGNRGEIRSGGAQWMSAGKGIIHSEMPELDGGGLHGFQLWINLPAKEKMSTPKYRDVPATEIPVITLDNEIEISVIAGSWNIQESQVNGPLDSLAADARYLDITLPAGESLTLPIEAELRPVVYVYEGELESGQTVQPKSLLIYSIEGDELTLTAKTDSKLLLLCGKPILEPIAHYGPFVMNTAEEIEQAIQDYNSGNFGQ